ncbi:WD repeat-containing protein 74-like [Chenopodium quinoa]|uniref:WD repeat-containing protein 74-like n=1 Tax=Chenopodium quinoa TaxID=63459 RepID=UPI000B77C429|nr:WD repeat-containing protein 74-like [Chenopodium quinoa]XP_021759382.1 WD repeat-containing protein 74-like [Chenopodium quinoa]XP_021759384.1 WD repeat-containing protein 74-like [Chenopodium quinoa]
MPRTTTIECPGCPPLRALTFDVLGLVKVIEARSKQGGVPKVVERWGDPDSSKAILAASINDRKSNPLLAVARKNGSIEVLSPVSGELCFSISDDGDDTPPLDDPIAGLHLFKKRMVESSSRSCTLLSCTTKGKAILRRIEDFDSQTGSVSSATPEMWNVCSSGEICCSKVHADEGYSVFGGKGIEINMWDLEKTSKIWSAKSPRANNLGIFTPTCFTSLTFLSNDDHRKVVAGTKNHQVRLYDTSAQRRPVLSIDFRETPIKSVAEDLDGHTIYVGNGSGDLGSFDIRTGKLLGCFFGKCSGSIRSITRHPEHSVIASCGLDSYVRFWDINSRQLLSAVFLKQHLTNVVFDSNFSDEEATIATDSHIDEIQVISNEEQYQNEEDALPVKRKKASKEKSEAKKKSKKVKKVKDEVRVEE